jgi:type III secretion system low calcium response chaperone LcrH/SycD
MNIDDDPDLAAAQVFAKRLEAHLRSGGTMAQWLNIAPEDLQAMYALGGFFYEREEYDSALRIYTLLQMADPYERRFMIAAGMSKQMLKLYDDALGYYAQALAFDFDDPLPSLHMAECLVHKGQPGDALTLLNVCLRRAQKPEHQELREQALQLHQLIEAARPKEAQP